MKPGRHLHRLRTHRPPLRQRQRCVDEISSGVVTSFFELSTRDGLIACCPAAGLFTVDVHLHLGPVKPSRQRQRDGPTHSAFGIHPPGQIAVDKHAPNHSTCFNNFHENQHNMHKHFNTMLSYYNELNERYVYSQLWQ